MEEIHSLQVSNMLLDLGKLFDTTRVGIHFTGQKLKFPKYHTALNLHISNTYPKRIGQCSILLK